MDGTNVNVDDLFNDDDLQQAALNIPLSGNDVVDSSGQALSLEAKIQLDELHTNGCRQRMAWSRLGCVASILEDSASVSIQCLKLNRRTAAWELSSKYSLEVPADEAIPHVWTHLCWSSTGTDLAIFDDRGRVSIFGMSTASAVNRFQDLSFPNPDSGDELRQAVGTFWLPAADRETLAISQASKQDDQWTLVLTKRKSIGPTWPRALLLVTRLGVLRLLYMKPDRTWSETDEILFTPSTAKDLLTHAAFASTVEGTILVTTHSANGAFSVHLVHVNRPPLASDQMENVVITLNIEHIKSDIYIQSSSNIHTNNDLMNGNPPGISSLSHLEIVPTTDIEKAVQTPPTIFAIATNYSNLHNTTQPKSSTIHRWSLYPVAQTLHPRFDEIPTKGTASKSTSTTPIKTLQRLPPIPFDGIITSVHLVDSSTALAITTADGTTTFYNPSSMSALFYESSPVEITSLSQAGFAFPLTPDPFGIAFSPNACCAVSLPSNTSTITSTSPQLTSMTSPTPSLAALLLTYTRACYAGATSDDTLTCILSSVSPIQIPQFSALMLQTLFRDADFKRHGEPGSELDKLAHKPLVPKGLSLIAALGVRLANREGVKGHRGIKRDLPARYAWLTLQIRHIAMQLVYVVNSTKSKEPLPPEVLAMTIAAVVWVSTLIRWIVDELCAMEDGEESPPDVRELVGLILGGVWSRYFLRMCEKVLRTFASSQMQMGWLEGVVRTVREQSAMGVSLQGLVALLEASERFSVSGKGAEGERQLIATGRGGKGLLERIVRELLPGLRRGGEVDKLRVYTSVNIGSSVVDGDQEVDVHWKTRIKVKKGGEIRRCVRCACVSADAAGPRREWPKWLQQTMTRCICEAGFWVEGWDD